MNTGVDYKLFYEILLNLRETFHSYGRIDDSNAKLDEIVKLLILSYYEALHNKKFSIEEIKKESKRNFGDSKKVAMTLRTMFEMAAKDDIFTNNDGTSIFGSNATLNIQPTEDLFAERLIAEIEKIDFVNLLKENKTNNFDILNECFGHFVRENFRNNKEDAQYMTPSEITLPVLDMVFSDFIKENYFEQKKLSDFKIMDPTCGVGTLIIESSRKFIQFILKSNFNNEEKNNYVKYFLENGIIGQDKVDRMIRLSKLNLILMGGNSQNIYAGNSISDFSDIDNYKGTIDFIFTNPPFGAEYNANLLDFEKFGYIKNIKNEYKTYSSEILMLFKCIDLLKDNGKLAIVLPDSVFSAKGINSSVREILIKNVTINAIIEMPAVTFAQAGTRTKTSILYLTKKKPNKHHKIIMSICNDIGYVVKERAGVPVKIQKGKNEMLDIAANYTGNKGEQIIVSNVPSVTQVEYSDLIDSILNPSFYSAERYSTIMKLQNSNIEGYEIRSLSDIVKFDTIGRKNKNVSDKIKHISVLHINTDSTIDMQQVINYSPISKGRECQSGDIIFSKINPRIPRMAVIPNCDYDLVCSNEFEILIPKVDIGAYAICMILRTSYVSKQIEDLTSGTSSSHNRIKREQLGNIKILYPDSIKAKEEIKQINNAIKLSFEEKYKADNILREQRMLLENII